MVTFELRPSIKTTLAQDRPNFKRGQEVVLDKAAINGRLLRITGTTQYLEPEDFKLTASQKKQISQQAHDARNETARSGRPIYRTFGQHERAR